MTDESLLRQFKCQTKANSANKRFDDKITKYDVLFSLKLNDFKCFYCNDKIDFKYWELDHFYSRAMFGKNEKSNLVACCKWCNTMKNALDGNSFLAKCSQILENNFFVKNNCIEFINNKKNTLKFKKIKKLLSKHNLSDSEFLKIKEILNNFY